MKLPRRIWVKVTGGRQDEFYVKIEQIPAGDGRKS